MKSQQGQKKIEKYAFSMKNMLGKGSYASVYQGRVIATDQPVAIKVMSKTLFTNSFNLKNIMKKLNHKNIVRMLDVFQTPNNMYIITQLCDQGDLMAFTRKKKRVSQRQALKIFQDILQGYRYLHNNKITHRDIKPANILIHQGVCKLVDFGFAKRADTQTVMCSLVGTPLYMSPQILRREKYTSKADIWSVGLIFYQLIFGGTPWMAYNQTQLLQNITKKPLAFPSHISISDNSKQIITSCLQIKQQQRISWDDLFQMVIIKRDRTPLREIGKRQQKSKLKDREKQKQNNDKTNQIIKDNSQTVIKGSNKIQLPIVSHKALINRPTTPLSRVTQQGNVSPSPLRTKDDISRKINFDKLKF